MPRGAYILPTTASVKGATTAVVTRSSAKDGANSAIMAACAPYVNEGTQNVTISASGKVTLLDGRCIVRAGRSTASGAHGGDKTTIGSCAAHPEQNATWTYSNRTGHITSAFDGRCISRVEGGGPYLTVLQCHTNSTHWAFVPSAAASLTGVLVAEGSPSSRLCFTAVEQSFIADVAMATRVVEPGTGEPVTGAGMVVVDDTRVTIALKLKPGQVVTVVTAVLTSHDVHGAAFAKHPLKDTRVLSGAIDGEVVDAATELVRMSAKRTARNALFEAHVALWRSLWNKSSITLLPGAPEPDPSTKIKAALELMEANYFGSQYAILGDV